jgi:hypothetical protein
MIDKNELEEIQRIKLKNSYEKDKKNYLINEISKILIWKKRKSL